MKKVIVPLILLIVLIGVFVALFLTQEDTSVVAQPQSEFAIKDTAAVDQVKITEANGHSIVVQRRTTPGVWKLNDGNFSARPDAINLILETVYRIKVKQEVDPNAKANVIRQIAARNKKVEFFKGGESSPFKTYYIGNATPDKLGTYMLLKVGEEKAEVPYIMHKPGMYGSLDSRFFSDITEWRSHAVFSYGVGEISKVHFQFFEEPQNSHVVEVMEDGKVKLFDNSGDEVQNFDVSAVHTYITTLRNLNYEGFNKELGIQEADSLMSSMPLYKITVTDIQGNDKTVIIHRKAAPEGMRDYNDQPILWDRDKCWGYIKGSNELMRLQYFSWGAAFKPITHFTGGS